jgi:hypothetical protein
VSRSRRDTVRLRATWVVEYDANPADYPPEFGQETMPTPQQMATMDSDPESVESLMACGEWVSFRVDVATTPPTSQHVDEDPERSMQEDRVDIP